MLSGEIARRSKRQNKRGLMKMDKQNDRLSLTREGIYISDDIMGDFMIV